MRQPHNTFFDSAQGIYKAIFLNAYPKVSLPINNYRNALLATYRSTIWSARLDCKFHNRKHTQDTLATIFTNRMKHKLHKHFSLEEREDILD